MSRRTNHPSRLNCAISSVVSIPCGPGAMDIVWHNGRNCVSSLVPGTLVPGAGVLGLGRHAAVEHPVLPRRYARAQRFIVSPQLP